MKKKLKKGLIVTSALSASMFNTPALITDAMAHAAETDANETTTNTNKNNSTNNVENNNQTNTENNTVDKNTDTDKNTEVKNTVNDSDKVSKDSSIGPGYYSQPNTKAKSLLSAFSTAVPASTSSFINSVANGAVNGWKKYKVLPSVTIAQAILESAWGGSALTIKANNLFGIKGRYNGQYVTMPTWEVINGHSVMVNAEFRKYPSRDVSMEDHGNFLTVNSRYRNLIGVTNYKTVTKLLQQDGYATDPAYPGKLNSIIETYGLTKYDDIAIEPNVGAQDALVTSEKTLTTVGWHAATKAANKSYSYMFLMDANTGKELTRVKINRTTRNDVQKAYPNIKNAAQSGYNTNFNITDKMRGKKVYVMSRYSSDPSGNTDTIDYRFGKVITIPKITTKASSMDHATATASNIHFDGWQIDNNSEGKPYSYAILLNASTGKEVKRVKVDRFARNDVQKKYPEVYNSANGGFSVDFPVTDDMRGTSYKVVLRYSSDTSGNGSSADVWFNNKITVPAWQKGNHASMDSLSSPKSQTVGVHGWHANSDTADKQYRFLIFMDAKTNKEIKRVKISSLIREDVKKAYPNVRNAEKSGFGGDFTDSRFKGKKIKVISRYSSDPTGNSKYIDNWFANIVTVK